jgi:hypothetical protein
MSKFTLSDRDARALRVGAIAVVPALLIQLVLRPYQQTMRGQMDALQSERALLARELGVLNDRSSYDSLAVEAARVLAATEAQLFSGSDDVVATAALSQFVGDHARRASVLMEQVETRNAQPLGDGLVAIDVAIRGESDLEGVLAFLRNLEYGDKLVTIPEFRAEPEARDETQPDSPAVLGFSVTVRGYALIHAPDTARVGERK